MNANLEKMLETVSNKLGMDPSKLKAAINGGQPEEIISGMKPEDRQKLEAALKNKELREKILNTREAQAIKKQMGGDK